MRAEGDKYSFVAQQQARDTLDFTEEWRLASGAVDAVLAGQPVAEAEAQRQQKRRDLLARQGALTDFRLFWETAGKALAGRDLLLIDAEGVRGQRNLMLFDPELLRTPIPMWRPAP
jgi:hypothetical protein